MGQYKFSATTTAFYPVEMLDMYEQAGTLPADLVDVTDETYTEFTGQPPEGKMRGGDKNGQPAWVDIPQPTPEQLRNQAEQKKAQLLDDAYAAMKPLELAVKHDMATDEEKAKLEAWERYSVLLSRVDVDNPEWPDKPE
ncbi:tail fiber assembly protein [Serratia ureilytica]|uniref:Tail fiber assembly protein n=1 Tax=Serratia ureilytica TaxID=300181 RepID=A0A9X9BXB2_9GAMM|nr:tail fiber assembly protein [Serratia ureilytica]TXE22162.1 tail fiber assembly protein [Serratia ureilytica]